MLDFFNNGSIPQKIDPYDFDYLSASSANDCTGLIPAAPEDEAALEAYEDLYPYLPSAVSKNKAKQ